MKTIFFKIISNENDSIYQEGYVEVPEDIEELPDWFYYDQNGFAQPRQFTNHDEIGLTQIGATSEQEAEVEDFLKVVTEDEIDFIDDAILTADEDENRTYVRNGITVIVNDGAMMECEIKDTEKDSFHQYFVELVPRFNGEHIDLANFMKDNGITFDPYCIGDDVNSFIEDGHIYFEISRDWFEGDDEDREDNLKVFINPEVENIYKRYLTSIENLGVYGIAGSIYEEKYGKLNESECDAFASRWEQAFEDFDITDLYFMSSEDVEKIIKEEMD